MKVLNLDRLRTVPIFVFAGLVADMEFRSEKWKQFFNLDIDEEGEHVNQESYAKALSNTNYDGDAFYVLVEYYICS